MGIKGEAVSGKSYIFHKFLAGTAVRRPVTLENCMRSGQGGGMSMGGWSVRF